jgi:hypothetical protein
VPPLSEPDWPAVGGRLSRQAFPKSSLVFLEPEANFTDKAAIPVDADRKFFQETGNANPNSLYSCWIPDQSTTWILLTRFGTVFHWL